MRVNTILYRQQWRSKLINTPTSSLPADKNQKRQKAPWMAPSATHPGLTCRCPSAAQEGAHGQK